MFFFDHIPGAEDLTIRQINETMGFIREITSLVSDHTMILIADPHHQCSPSDLDLGDGSTQLTDQELKTFFAMEESFKLLFVAAREALKRNGQLSTDPL